MPKPLKAPAFKVYLLDKSRPGLEEGFVNLIDHKTGSITSHQAAFDSLDDIGSKMRDLLIAANVTWPKP